jgi:hypothetical protein
MRGGEVKTRRPDNSTITRITEYNPCRERRGGTRRMFARMEQCRTNRREVARPGVVWRARIISCAHYRKCYHFQVEHWQLPWQVAQCCRALLVEGGMRATFQSKDKRSTFFQRMLVSPCVAAFRRHAQSPNKVKKSINTIQKLVEALAQEQDIAASAQLGTTDATPFGRFCTQMRS